MIPTLRELSKWFDDGIEQEAKYMLVIYDSVTYTDYPIYVSAEEDVRDIVNKFRLSPMQRIMEVYNLEIDKSTQLKEERTFNLPDNDTRGRKIVS